MLQFILKQRAKWHYMAYFNGLDEFSCGASMAEHIRPSLRRHANKFNRLLDRLAELDPATPKSRL